MKKLASSLKGMEMSEGMQTVVFAPSPYLATLAEELRYEPVMIGADNVSCPIGDRSCRASSLSCSHAPTGELCPDELAVLGCRAVLLGSMDRRICLNETSETVALKAAYSAVHGLRPYILFGELFNGHPNGVCRQMLEDQIDPVIRMLCDTEEVCVRDISLVYEPWTDAEGRAPDSAQIEEAAAFVTDRFKDRTGVSPEILYGGELGDNTLTSVLKLKGFGGIMLDADEL